MSGKSSVSCQKKRDFIDTYSRANKTDCCTQDISRSSDMESALPPEIPCARPTSKTTSVACARCTATEDLTPCSKCGSTFYCSRECQTTHWLRHKFDCSLGRPIDEVDYFIIACKTEELPKDDDVAKAFGLLYFTSAADLQRLFRLYCRLVNEWGVEEDELREAWQQNKLKEFILFRSSQIPSSLIHAESRWISQQDGFAANKITDLFNVLFESQLKNMYSSAKINRFHMKSWSPGKSSKPMYSFARFEMGMSPTPMRITGFTLVSAQLGMATKSSNWRSYTGCLSIDVNSKSSGRPWQNRRWSIFSKSTVLAMPSQTCGTLRPF